MGPCLIVEEKEYTLIFSWISLNAQNAARQPSKIRNLFKTLTELTNKSECNISLPSVFVSEKITLRDYPR